MADNINIFEVATREKMRFPFKGLISVEDLWDLTLENLDSIYKRLKSAEDDAKKESLLNKNTDVVLETKIKIVEYVFNVKREEKETRLKEKENAAKRQKIYELLEEKDNEELKGKSKEELLKMLKEME